MSVRAADAYCSVCDSEACVCALGPTPLRAVEDPEVGTAVQTSSVSTQVETRVRTRFTAAELCETEFEPPRYAVPDLLPEGFGLLCGAPKLGKSWLGLGIGIAVASGGRALGKIRCEQGEALYLGLEDTPRRLKQRLQMLLKGDAPPPALTLDTEWPSIREGGIERIGEWLAQHPSCRLVVIDVLARMRSATPEKADRYATDYQTAQVLKTVADEYGVGIYGVHHTRKAQSDDFLEDVSGTNGLAGGADSILVLRRKRTEAGAELHVTGRDIEERQMALTFSSDAGTWTYAGDAAEAALSAERRAIIDALRVVGVPLSPKEVSELAGVSSSHDTCKHLLPKMAEAGQVVATGRGTYLPHSLHSPEGQRE